MILDLGKSFLLDRDHNDFVSSSARRVQHEEGKRAVTSDKAEFFLLGGHEVIASRFLDVHLGGSRRHKLRGGARRG